MCSEGPRKQAQERLVICAISFIGEQCQSQERLVILNIPFTGEKATERGISFTGSFELSKEKLVIYVISFSLHMHHKDLAHAYRPAFKEIVNLGHTFGQITMCLSIFKCLW